MSSELMKVVPPHVERSVAKAAKRIYDQIRIAGVEVDVQVALAGHVMEKVVELDERRKELAGNDAGLNALLCDVELHTVRNIKRTQDRTQGGWNR